VDGGTFSVAAQLRTSSEKADHPSAGDLASSRADEFRLNYSRPRTETSQDGALQPLVNGPARGPGTPFLTREHTIRAPMAVADSTVLFRPLADAMPQCWSRFRYLSGFGIRSVSDGLRGICPAKDGDVSQGEFLANSETACSALTA